MKRKNKQVRARIIHPEGSLESVKMSLMYGVPVRNIIEVVPKKKKT
jgi:hypothetical protein